MLLELLFFVPRQWKYSIESQPLEMLYKYVVDKLLARMEIALEVVISFPSLHTHTHTCQTWGYVLDVELYEFAVDCSFLLKGKPLQWTNLSFTETHSHLIQKCISKSRGLSNFFNIFIYVFDKSFFKTFVKGTKHPFYSKHPFYLVLG